MNIHAREAENLLFGEPIWRLNASKDQITHTMSKTESALFELGQRTEFRTRSVAVGGVFQMRFGGENFKHLFGIVFPVRC